MVVFNVVSSVTDIDGMRGLAALFAFVLFFVEAFLLEAYVFQPFLKRLKGVKDNSSKSKMSPQLQNELHYADYLVWAARKGYAPEQKKVEVATFVDYNDI